MAEQNATPDLELNVPAAPSLTLEAEPALTLDPAADEKVVEEARKAAPVTSRWTATFWRGSGTLFSWGSMWWSPSPRWSCSPRSPKWRRSCAGP